MKDYGHALAHDPHYAARPNASALTKDLSELLPGLVQTLKERRVKKAARPKLATPPRTLQHAQQLRGGVELSLAELGFERGWRAESHLCCGSGLAPTACCSPSFRSSCATASSKHLAPRKWTPVSANIGCIQHLQLAAPARRCATG